MSAYMPRYADAAARSDARKIVPRTEIRHIVWIIRSVIEEEIGKIRAKTSLDTDCSGTSDKNVIREPLHEDYFVLRTGKSSGLRWVQA